MLRIELLNPTTYIVNPNNPQYEGLVIHGYGSNKEEIIGLALKVSLNLSARIVVFDLPGHGASQELLSLTNALASLADAAAQLVKVDFAIGHSLGAYLAMIKKFNVIAALSMPGEAVFEGDRKDQIRTLRARRVSEAKPYAALNEILKESIDLPLKTLLLKAEHDISSVNRLYEEWQKKGIYNYSIENTNHLDIINAPKTAEIVSNWLKEAL